MIIAAILFVVVLLAVAFFYRDLFAITFDEDLAQCSGIRTTTINTVLVLMTALTVVLAMKVVGIMLISALLILPAVSALQVARSFLTTIIASCCFATVSVITGIFGSFIMNLPTGGSIVIVNFILFIMAFTWKYARKTRV
jgi:zinc transport system permease protein